METYTANRDPLGGQDQKTHNNKFNQEASIA